jgi:triacylglycerol lipase
VTQHCFLVPGFFGFDHIGDVAYFTHVVDFLDGWARGQLLDLKLHVVKTPPTASLRHRAAFLVKAIAEATDAGSDVHIIGHSSGGLDGRLVVTPEVSLAADVDAEPIARRVRTVVTVATPHHGTPLAGFFSSLLGSQILAVFSVATSYALRTGRLPLDALAKLAALFVKPSSVGPPPTNALTRLYRGLLDDFSAENRARVESFMSEIGRDQDLLPQITTAAMDLFNASTDDRPGVRYGSVVTQVPPPGLRGFLGAGLRPYAHASHVLFLCISRIAARVPADRSAPLTAGQRQAVIQGLGHEPDRHANDGIVPTCSQAWGQVIRAEKADHLDVIGHFRHPMHVPPHFDWLTSGAGYTRKQFLELWEAVARFVFQPPGPSAIR